MFAFCEKKEGKVISASRKSGKYLSNKWNWTFDSTRVTSGVTQMIISV